MLDIERQFQLLRTLPYGNFLGLRKFNILPYIYLRATVDTGRIGKRVDLARPGIAGWCLNRVRIGKKDTIIVRDTIRIDHTTKLDPGIPGFGRNPSSWRYLEVGDRPALMIVANEAIRHADTVSVDFLEGVGGGLLAFSACRNVTDISAQRRRTG